ncbi:MAG: tetratricopeptide repeat protein [Alphaproteobacteria bacterium]
MRRLAAALICAIVLGGWPAAAETKRQRASVAFEAGIAAMQRRDFARARRQFERALELGALGAGYNLGLLYAYGWGVAADQRRACDYFATAARVRLPKPMHNLATCYYHGQGRPKDMAKAMIWYRRAAAGGYVRAYCALGNMLRKGQGVARDVAGGMALCRKAALAGDADAATDIGAAWLVGSGVAVDYKLAARWLSRAAGQGQRNAQFMYAQMLWNGDGVAKNHDLAACWLEAAARRGQSRAPFLLGQYYATRSQAKDAKAGASAMRAVMWLTVAARHDPGSANRAEAGKLARRLLDAEPGLFKRAQAEFRKIGKRKIGSGPDKKLTPVRCP